MNFKKFDAIRLWEGSSFELLPESSSSEISLFRTQEMFFSPKAIEENCMVQNYS